MLLLEVLIVPRDAVNEWLLLQVVQLRLLLTQVILVDLSGTVGLFDLAQETPLQLSFPLFSKLLFLFTPSSLFLVFGQKGLLVLELFLETFLSLPSPFLLKVRSVVFAYLSLLSHPIQLLPILHTSIFAGSDSYPLEEVLLLQPLTLEGIGCLLINFC